MPAGFSSDDIHVVAALAHLDLEPAEVELFARQLGDIIAHANEVQRVDTTGVPPTASISAIDEAERPDDVRPSLDRAEVMAAAPDAARQAGFFRVPRVVG